MKRHMNRRKQREDWRWRPVHPSPEIKSIDFDWRDPSLKGASAQEKFQDALSIWGEVRPGVVLFVAKDYRDRFRLYQTSWDGLHIRDTRFRFRRERWAAR